MLAGFLGGSHGHETRRSTALDHTTVEKISAIDKRLCPPEQRDGESLPRWAQPVPASESKQETLLLKTFITEYVFMRQFPNLIR